MYLNKKDLIKSILLHIIPLSSSITRNGLGSSDLFFVNKYVLNESELINFF